MKSYTKEDEKLFLEMQRAIKESVDKEVITLTKARATIDLDALENKHTKQFFKELEAGLQKLFPAEELFHLREHLKRDDPELFEEFEKKSKKYESILREKHPSHKTLEELKKISKDFLTKEELQKIRTLAESCFDQKEFEKARLYFTLLSGLSTPEAYIWVMRGLSAQNTNKYEEALMSYFLALHTDPHNFLAYLQMIEVLALTGKIQEASDLFAFIDEGIKHECRDNPVYLARIETIGDFLAKNKNTNERLL